MYDNVTLVVKTWPFFSSDSSMFDELIIKHISDIPRKKSWVFYDVLMSLTRSFCLPIFSTTDLLSHQKVIIKCSMAFPWSTFYCILWGFPRFLAQWNFREFSVVNPWYSFTRIPRKIDGNSVDWFPLIGYGKLMVSL